MKAKNHVSLRFAAGLPLLVCLALAPILAKAQTFDMGDELFAEEEVVRDASKGIVKGVVKSQADGQPVIEARVSVEGTSISTLTDLDGNFELELPPGTYEFRVWYELHQPQRVQNVSVEAGGEQSLDVSLVADGDAIQEVVVEVEADRSKAAVQLEKRKRAAVVMDAVSGEEMSRTPDSSAADAMKRVVGATVVDGKFLVVRGLGGRYTTTLLEGVAVPSPEPDQPAVPLDLFPSALLSSVTVAKTATPDLPGNFAGGALLIDSKQYPSEFKLNLKAGFSGDSGSTFENAPQFAGSSMNAFGFDDGSRSLPGSVPQDGPASRNRMSASEREAVGESFSQQYGSTESSLPPNLNLGGSVGDSIRLGGRRLGYLASLSWGRGFEYEEELDRKPTVEKDVFTEDVTHLSSIRKVKLGGLGSLAYELSQTDDIGFITLFSRSADDRAQVTRGSTQNVQTGFEETQLAFVARQLTFNQLDGHHRFPKAGGLELDWQANYSLVNRDEPDTRTIAYQELEDGRSKLVKERAPERLFSALDDRTVGGGLDLARPFEGWKPKIGALYSQSARDYQTRRFVYEARRLAGEQQYAPPDEILNADTIDGRTFDFQETTRASDSYTADFRLAAAYAMIDLTAFDPFRAIFGARYEHADTVLEHRSKFAVTDDNPVGVDRVEDDVLPSANLVYAISPLVNLRTAYAVTVARPQFRELSSASWYNFQKHRHESGNPALRRSRIHNADLRIEYFPGAADVLAASVFGKVFHDPIENVVYGDGGSVQPRNADRGVVYGLELESRLGLAHVDPSLRELGFTANLTLAQSEVELAPEDKNMMTNAARPLYGQSPYALNVGFLYEGLYTGTTAQLLYNVFGPRLDAVGINGIDDVYERTFHTLDLTVTQNLGGGFDAKVGATNLLDQEQVFATGDTEVSRFRPGVGASATLGWTF